MEEIVKKFIALTLTALAVVAMTSTPANAKTSVGTVTFTAAALPGGNWCC